MDFHSGEVSTVTIEPANEEEIRQTVAVMGGEDWAMWMDALNKAGVLASNAITVAYSYIGPEVTYSVYREGTIGRAKDDLEATAFSITKNLEPIGVRAYVSVNKALVTQASAAIPVIPLYISILFKLMKAQGVHEGCIEQIHRLFRDRLFSTELQLDDKGRIRIDDLEMKQELQAEVAKIWESASTENISLIGDLEGYRKDFFNLFGFGFSEIDYTLDVDPEINIPSIKEA